mmetsp:Transcript_123245/g.343734  ORF Transcript_123245/g.343734 Transcript_123245/m.343734 type:complete len:219 (+) Transcript_123245:223-879(+)
MASGAKHRPPHPRLSMLTPGSKACSAQTARAPRPAAAITTCDFSSSAACESLRCLRKANLWRCSSRHPAAKSSMPTSTTGSALASTADVSRPYALRDMAVARKLTPTAVNETSDRCTPMCGARLSPGVSNKSEADNASPNSMPVFHTATTAPMRNTSWLKPPVSLREAWRCQKAAHSHRARRFTHSKLLWTANACPHRRSIAYPHANELAAYRQTRAP